MVMLTGSGNRPRVLLADDHARLLESASRLLSKNFQIVGTVSNGAQAVDVAQRLDPDVIVLDIAMPDLDGFQTLHQLRATGSRATVVFLTTHETDEYMTAALRSGVRGYVLKTRMASDLAAAVHHALAGRVFMPSLTALSASTAGGGHIAHFHRDDRVVLEAVSRFVRASLRSGESLVVVGTEATRLAIAHHMQSSKMDLPAMERRGLYVATDAAQSLTEVMCGDRPDEACLAAIVEGLDRSRLESANGPASRLIVFGEMAVPLCRTGNVDGALAIERMWNRLTARLPIFTICSYPIVCFQNERAQASLSNLYTEHQAISHTLNS
jgi:DNA-binding NarL/FixJ family response regulator